MHNLLVITHTQHDRLFLLLVNWLVGAVNPRVGAQVSEAHIRVSEKTVKFFLILFYNRKLAPCKCYIVTNEKAFV